MCSEENIKKLRDIKERITYILELCNEKGFL